jgi:hypothetical protein
LLAAAASPRTALGKAARQRRRRRREQPARKRDARLPVVAIVKTLSVCLSVVGTVQGVLCVLGGGVRVGHEEE